MIQTNEILIDEPGKKFNKKRDEKKRKLIIKSIKTKFNIKIDQMTMDEITKQISNRKLI